MLPALGGCALRPTARVREAPRTNHLDGMHAGPPTTAELDQLCYVYADRYTAVLSSAVEAMVADNADPRQRREAHRLRVESVTAVDDVAPGSTPSPSCWTCAWW